MGEHSAPKLKRYLPHALAATVAVILLPIGVVSLLVTGGLLDSVFITGPVAMLLSLGTSSAGSAWWKKRRGAHDLVFSDLMIWGWLRRLRTERRISRAVELLGNRIDLPTEQQVDYFKELAAALEARDPYTHGHTRRVTAHAVAIAKTMGLSQEQIAKVRTAAAIHDIGKLNTPREVLNKPGRLSDEEFALIKQHPTDGAELAKRLGDPEITAMVLHHHERLDGSGYPGRLAGERIPLGARIIAVADTFDAITSKRPYRAASSHKKGMAILIKEAGTQLDPAAVRAFRSHYSGLRAVAIGSLLSSGPGQLLPWRWGLSSAAPLAKSVAAVAVAGVLGTTAAGLARPIGHAHAHRILGGRTSATAGALHPTFVSTGDGATYARQPAATADAHRDAGASHRGRSAGSRRAPSGPPRRLGSGSTKSAGNAAQPASPPGSGASPSSTGTDRGGSPSVGGGRSSGGAGSTGGSPSQGTGSSSRGGSSSGGTGSSAGGSGSTTSVGPVSVSVSPPPVTVTTQSVTQSTPSVTVSTPVGTVKTPTVTVTTSSKTASTPSLTVSTPSVTLP